MRFTCAHCGKRYLTSDALVPGRVYRIRCKACGGLISLKADAAAAVPATTEPPAPEAPRKAPTLGSLWVVPPSPPAGAATPHASDPSTEPPRPAAPRPPPPAPEPKYIDLFEGEDLDAPAATPPPGPARRKGGVAPSLIEPAATRTAPAAPPAAMPPRLAPDPDPLAAEPDPLALVPDPLGPAGPEPLAATARMSPPQPELSRSALLSHATPASAPEPDPGSPAPAAPPPSPGRMSLVLGLTAAAALVLVLLGIVLWRPWAPVPAGSPSQPEARKEELLPVARSSEPAAAAPAQPAATATAPTTPPAAPPAAAGAEPAPAVALAPQLAAPADDRSVRQARLERERQAKAEKLERERRAREERELLRAEKERTRRARLEQAKNATAEPAAPAGKAPPAAAPSPAPEAIEKGEPARDTAAANVPPAPPGGRLVAVEFTGVRSSRGGGDVNETVYSEKPNDARITGKSFADGLLTFTGQVGVGEDSKYAGIGLNVDILPGGKAIDASRFESMTIRLAGNGLRSLRIRLIGAESDTRLNGCYPIALQRVSEDAREYVVRFSEFEPESWCGSKGRSPSTTLKGLVGFEIADVSIDRKPVGFSVGSIVLNP